jgi:hypothetical protein
MESATRSLFTVVRDRNASYPPESAPPFEWVDGSSMPGMVQLRATLDGWFLRYPEDERAEFRRRFRLRDDLEPAFFELYLHELLLRLGYAVAVHPQLPRGAGARPDFLAERDGEPGFYLEALVVRGQTEEDRAADARMSVVFDALNKIDNPDFFFSIEIDGAPPTSPPATGFARRIERWLAGLDYEAVRACLRRDLSAEPKEIFCHKKEWCAIVRAWPKSEGLRARAGIPSLMARHRGMQEVDYSRTLAEKMRSKAGRYRVPERMLVLAVNALTTRLDRLDIMQALFGTERGSASDEANGQPRAGTTERMTDGLWRSSAGPRYGRVTGVLVVSFLYPWSAASQDLCLYLNPHAPKAELGALSSLSRAEARDGDMEWHEGRHPRKVLALPEGWPGQLHPK